MSHPLDRPVWNALNTAQAGLAVTTGAAVRIDPAYGPFAAARDAGEEAQAALAATLRGPEDRIGLVEREPWPLPPGTRAVGGGELVQMVFAEGLIVDAAPSGLRLLGQADAAEMAALARTTEPGPWGSKTHRYGDYYGIRAGGLGVGRYRLGGRLAAMAGERLRLPGMAEVSGVSTWPRYRGRGFAAALIQRVMRGMLERGDAPFLHCYAANVRAIALYESLGFRTRALMTFSILALA